MRDICCLLARNYWGYTRTNIPLNAFVSTAMTAGRWRPEFLESEAPYPLAVASVSKRRCLLAAACAILDPRIETGSALFGASAPPALETFLATVDWDAIDRCLASVGRWSPTFVRQIETTRRRVRQRTIIKKLRASLAGCNALIAPRAPTGSQDGVDIVDAHKPRLLPAQEVDYLEIGDPVGLAGDWPALLP